MKGRLWYPQLDVYDAIRRMAGLLAAWRKKAEPSTERFFVADFYFANPQLLHHTHMTREVRREFMLLGVQRPEKAFVSLPSAPVLFKKMEEVQKEAIRTLSGKGLLDIGSLGKGNVSLSSEGLEIFSKEFQPLIGSDEGPIIKFLVNHFVQSDSEIDVLRRSTGLRRIS